MMDRWDTIGEPGVTPDDELAKAKAKISELEGQVSDLVKQNAAKPADNIRRETIRAGDITTWPGEARTRDNQPITPISGLNIHDPSAHDPVGYDGVYHGPAVVALRTAQGSPHQPDPAVQRTAIWTRTANVCRWAYVRHAKDILALLLGSAITAFATTMLVLCSTAWYDSYKSWEVGNDKIINNIEAANLAIPVDIKLTTKLFNDSMEYMSSPEFESTHLRRMGSQMETLKIARQKKSIGDALRAIKEDGTCRTISQEFRPSEIGYTSYAGTCIGLGFMLVIGMVVLRWHAQFFFWTSPSEIAGIWRSFRDVWRYEGVWSTK